MRRRRKSCRSHGEKEIIEFFEENKIGFKKEVSFNECRNSKGNMLRFDFMVDNSNILIEYQGIHHYQPINKYSRAKRVHETTKIHDQIKKEFCKKYNFNLLCIPYWERKNITQLLHFLLEENYGNS